MSLHTEVISQMIGLDDQNNINWFQHEKDVYLVTMKINQWIILFKLTYYLPLLGSKYRKNRVAKLKIEEVFHF